MSKLRDLETLLRDAAKKGELSYASVSADRDGKAFIALYRAVSSTSPLKAVTDSDPVNALVTALSTPLKKPGTVNLIRQRAIRRQEDEEDLI